MGNFFGDLLGSVPIVGPILNDVLGNSPQDQTTNALQDQQRVSKDELITKAMLDRYNQNSPFGSTTWDKSKDGLSWTQNTTLSPDQQRIFDLNNANREGAAWLAGQQGSSLLPNFGEQISGSMQGLTDTQNMLSSTLQNQIAGAYDKPLDYSSLGPRQGNLDYYDTGTRQRVEDALYQRSASRLDPQFQQSESDLTSRLAAQGITQGSEAYGREVGNMSRSKNDAYDLARTSAITGGGDAMQQEFGIANDQYGSNMVNRASGVNELNYLRNAPLTEANTMQGIVNSGTSNMVNLLNGGLNQINSLNSIGQATQPTLNPFNASSTVTPTDVLTPTIAANNAQTKSNNNTGKDIMKFVNMF